MKQRKRECDRVRHLQKVLVLQVLLLLLLVYLHPASGQAGSSTGARIDAHTDARIDAHTDARIDAHTDAHIEG